MRETEPATVLANEHEELLEFLYSCPYGLAQFDDRGVVSLCNPEFARLALPLLPAGGGMLLNLVEVLLPLVPTLPTLLQSTTTYGMLCEGLRLYLEPPVPGVEPGVLSLTIMRLAPSRQMALLSDVTEQVAQERRLRESEEADTRARIAEAENRALEDRIREQERMREILRLSENKFRRLFESSTTGILIVDGDDGLILDANPSMLTLLDHPRTDVVGRALWEVGAFGAVVADQPGYNTLQQKPSRRYHDVPLQTRTAVIDVELTSIVYLDESKQKVQINVQDITERKATNRLVVHAQKMTAVGILTGGLAHNINNLLAVVVGNLDLLQDQVYGDDAGSEYAREAMNAAMRGGALISSMLAFAREQPLRLEKIDVGTTVAKIAHTFGEILGDGITLLTPVADEACWPVLSDHAQLEASILNLVTNAVEAMPSGGVLTIAACNRRLALTREEIESATPGDYVEISVSDTGTGMSPEIIEQIFEPFFTTKGTAAKQGTGLGLSTVFGFAKQSGGDIKVESATDKGTTFRLHLPRCKGEEPSVELPSSRLAKEGNETILVVEDNEALARVVARQLTRLGYKVLQATDGATALAVLRGNRVDLLFSDISLPGGMGGVEFARMARDGWPSLKVILTTGFDNAANRADAGDLTIIMKPYRITDLGRALRAVLDGTAIP